MTAIALAIAIAVSPASAPSQAAGPDGRQCTRWDRRGWPDTIAVHLIHRKGSTVPARVVRVDFEDYLGTVAASGAWPAWLPMESIKAGIVVLATRAAWMVAHPQPGYRWRGRCYDIHSGSPRKGLRGADAGQLYRHGTYVHSRIRKALAAVHGSLLRRPDGTLRKPRWSGTPTRCGQGVTGNALPARAASDCARRGWSWRRVLAHYFPKGTVSR